MGESLLKPKRIHDKVDDCPQGDDAVWMTSKKHWPWFILKFCQGCRALIRHHNIDGKIVFASADPRGRKFQECFAGSNFSLEGSFEIMHIVRKICYQEYPYYGSDKLVGSPNGKVEEDQDKGEEEGHA